MENNEFLNSAENTNGEAEVNNNGAVRNANDQNTNGAPSEHVISYRTDDARAQNIVSQRAEESRINGAYHMNAEQLRQATSGVTYTSADTAPVKRKKKSHAGLVAFLVIIGMLLSTGCGMLGAYVANEYLIDDADVASTPDTSPVVIHRDTTVTTSAEGGSLSYSDIEAAVGDSVVAISTEYMNQGFWGYVTQGAGSGVVMSADGYIITNNHVVARSDDSELYADTITVRMKNGDEYSAEVIGGSAEADIAVIKADIPEDTELVPAVFGDSDKLAVGEEVLAIGNPLGTLSGTLTNGIISALAREVEVEGVSMNLLQTNTAINPGNSGGGLFNMDGKLIGIVNAKSSGTEIEGIGFAIPVNDALETAEKIIENGGSIKEPTVIVGITTYNIQTVSDARQFNVNALGVYIYSVEKGYNDDVLKYKDRIIAVDGTEITSGSDVSDIVKSHKAGDVIEFTIYRDGKLMNVDVKCFSSEESPE